MNLTILNKKSSFRLSNNWKRTANILTFSDSIWSNSVSKHWRDSMKLSINITISSINNITRIRRLCKLVDVNERKWCLNQNKTKKLTPSVFGKIKRRKRILLHKKEMKAKGIIFWSPAHDCYWVVHCMSKSTTRESPLKTILRHKLGLNYHRIRGIILFTHDPRHTGV